MPCLTLIFAFDTHYRKDVRLPVQLQRAMAAEAEAAREARAKVIAAEGEQKASRALKEASDVISESPAGKNEIFLDRISLENIRIFAQENPRTSVILHFKINSCIFFILILYSSSTPVFTGTLKSIYIKKFKIIMI